MGGPAAKDPASFLSHRSSRRTRSRTRDVHCRTRPRRCQLPAAQLALPQVQQRHPGRQQDLRLMRRSLPGLNVTRPHRTSMYIVLRESPVAVGAL